MIQPGQSLVDIVLQHMGDLSALFQVAAENGISVTDPLRAGGTIMLPATTENPRNVRYFVDKEVMIGTARVESLAGIGYWDIGGLLKIG